MSESDVENTAQEMNGAEEVVAENDLQAALQVALTKVTEAQDMYMRARAEVENVRRRAQEDIAKAHKFAVESFAEALIPVMDSLEKAIEQGGELKVLQEGVELTFKQLQSAFAKGKLTVIDPAGEKFDPHQHQAISTIPAPNVPDNHVVQVLQKGWLLADRVVRPALVIVARQA